MEGIFNLLLVFRVPCDNVQGTTHTHDEKADTIRRIPPTISILQINYPSLRTLNGIRATA